MAVRQGSVTNPVPRLGAIAVVISEGHVLLAQRRNPPDAGLWGFPGGHVELGETALAAAARELLEETGVIAAPVDYITNIDVIGRDAGGQTTLHYLLVAVLCDYVSGTPCAADDVEDAAWFPFEQVRRGDLPMSDRVASVLNQAIALRR
ncbi:NUDIX hydrolase [Sedimentitalea todarodis]|uniref:NUDIX hydrolase n=1 Tax=Sedimentitalea todarodis TaxID=1631240 RepID=A0ABU3VHN0_9RHOB|nr:NUDIX hydrolase [Sedimentitalea todarodis]MDU9005670.1 NUDIX hydrolase [Sedimentitalea todarodis]